MQVYRKHEASRDSERPENRQRSLRISIVLLKAGEGKIEGTTDSLIHLPLAVNIVDSETDLVQFVFLNIKKKYDDVGWLTSRAILTPTNSRWQCINDKVAEQFPGKFSAYESADSVTCSLLEAQNATELRCPQELLNSIEVESSLSDHEMSLNKEFIVMLLRNIKPSSGHVIRTKQVVESMTPNLPTLTCIPGSRMGGSTHINSNEGRISHTLSSGDVNFLFEFALR